jgi:hypothetical protein
LHCEQRTSRKTRHTDAFGSRGFVVGSKSTTVEQLVTKALTNARLSTHCSAGFRRTIATAINGQQCHLKMSRNGENRAADYGIDLLLFVAIVSLCSFMIGIEWGFRLGP